MRRSTTAWTTASASNAATRASARTIRSAQPSTTFKAGDLVQVTLSFELTKERRFVAVTDPLPAGFEPVESWFNTTASTLTRAAGSA